MNRSEWITKARELLEGNPDAAELLAAPVDAPTVVIGEVIEPEPARQRVRANPRRASSVSSTSLATKAPPTGKRSVAMSRAGRFVVRKLTEPDEAESRLFGTERLEVAAHDLTEKAVDRGLDALEGAKDKLPSLRNRGAAFAGRRLGRAK